MNSQRNSRRSKPGGFPLTVGAGVVCAALLAAAVVTRAEQTPVPRGPTPQEEGVTPVSGPSWLKRVGVSGGQSTLGRGAGGYGPGSTAAGERGAIRLPLGQAVAITGADIYRLNCQPCHRAEGTGAPPEIKSVLGAVQGSSLALVREQLRAEGKNPGDASARVASARADLYARIQKGGQRMPALDHLQRADVDLLYAYLTELAHTPDAKPAGTRTVSWQRFGEQLVKGTCHICHDASGPRPSPQQLLQGAIPPLGTFLANKNVAEFVKKARTGGPVVMGEPPFPHRGRMPVFNYLRDEEVAAGYMYLVAYPPK
jgi:mono/diheme cytochrome c family protein